MKNIFYATATLVLLAIFLSLRASNVHAQSTISDCVNASDGSLRIVTSGMPCKKNETLITWPSVDINTLGSLNCNNGQIPKFNGTSKSWYCAADNDTDTNTLATLTCSAGQTVSFNGAAWVCDPPPFQLRNYVTGVQTFFDNGTGLEWEMKVYCNGQNLANPHCVDNLYTWSANAYSADGTLFNDFLLNLNDSTGLINPAGCYASHCDWRIPTRTELLTLHFPNDTIGPVAFEGGWSSTTLPPNQAITVEAGDLIESAYKGNLRYARAVRGGR